MTKLQLAKQVNGKVKIAKEILQIMENNTSQKTVLINIL